MKLFSAGAVASASYLATKLSVFHHDVTVIESDPAKCEQMRSTIDAMIFEGSGVSPRDLIDAGARKADLLVAATSIDEVNIMA